MLASSLLIYRYLKQLGRDQARAMQQQSGRFSIAGMLVRLFGRFREKLTAPRQAISPQLAAGGGRPKPR